MDNMLDLLGLTKQKPDNLIFRNHVIYYARFGEDKNVSKEEFYRIFSFLNNISTSKAFSISDQTKDNILNLNGLLFSL